MAVRLRQCGWFSIDESDNDPFSFANYFIGALNKATNDSCPKTAAMVQRSQFGNLKSLFTQLFAEIAPWQEKAYLVLDDYHLIDDADIHSAVSHFIKHMPQNLTLVITSRTQPPLALRTCVSVANYSKWITPRWRLMTKKPTVS